MYCREELYPTVRAKGPPDYEISSGGKASPVPFKPQTRNAQRADGGAMHGTCVALILNSRNGITEHQDGEA